MYLINLSSFWSNIVFIVKFLWGQKRKSCAVNYILLYQFSFVKSIKMVWHKYFFYLLKIIIYRTLKRRFFFSVLFFVSAKIMAMNEIVRFVLLFQTPQFKELYPISLKLVFVFFVEGNNLKAMEKMWRVKG